MNLRSIQKSVPLAMILLGSFSVANAAELSLLDAIQLAKQRNGTLKSAEFNVRGARASLAQTRTSLLPKVTPTFRYDTNDTERFTGSLGDTRTSGSSLDITASYRVLDNGSRKYNILSNKANLAASEAQLIQTLRSTLFSVIQKYYEALRAQELFKVQKAQLDRATLILNQTKARAEVGDIARKDILQAEADQLNAQVALLQAEQRVRTSVTSLKAEIGWEQKESLELAGTSEVAYADPTFTLDQANEMALTQRPDLSASRAQLKSSEMSVRLAQAQAGFDYSVDATFTRSFARDVFNRSAIGLAISIPLFDGGASKLEVAQRKYSLEAAKARYVQSERDVLAEVEQAYTNYTQNQLRLKAANAALAAARKNFEAAVKAQSLGAAALPEVVQAQTSLVQAEVNAVEAIYDSLISDSQLRLAVGLPLAGE